MAVRLQAQRLGLQRVVVGLRDQAQVEHLLGLLQLGDRIVGRGRDGLLHAAHAHHAGRHADAHQARRTAGLAGRLDALRDAGLQVRVAARAGQRIGALHGLQQFLGVRVVLDGDDRDLDDREAAIGAPLVGVLHRLRQALARNRSSPAAAW